jgi:hypothetical protein
MAEELPLVATAPPMPVGPAGLDTPPSSIRLGGWTCQWVWTAVPRRECHAERKRQSAQRRHHPRPGATCEPAAVRCQPALAAHDFRRRCPSRSHSTPPKPTSRRLDSHQVNQCQQLEQGMVFGYHHVEPFRYGCGLLTTTLLELALLFTSLPYALPSVY